VWGRVVKAHGGGDDGAVVVGIVVGVGGSGCTTVVAVDEKGGDQSGRQEGHQTENVCNRDNLKAGNHLERLSCVELLLRESLDMEE